MHNKTQTIVIGSLFSAIAAFSLIGFIFWTVVPQFQGRDYLKKAAVAYTPDVIVNDTFIFQPMTSSQGLIRTLLVTALIQKYNDGALTKPDPLVNKAIDELKAYTVRFPHYYDYFMLLGKAYDLQAILYKDPSYSKLAEDAYKQAIAVAPGRQDAIYAYAINLLTQNRTDDALSVLRASIATVPELPDGHYELGQALAVAGKDRYNEALSEFEIALNGGANLNKEFTVSMYQKFFYYYYHNGDVARFQTSIKRLAMLDPAQSAEYQKVLVYVDANHTIPPLDIQQGQ